MILTEEIIRSAGQSFLQHSQFSHHRFDEAKDNYDLFISHSFQDRTLISGLYALFEDAGYSVYVDWIEDSDLNRQEVTARTADLLRKRINSSKGLAYIATDNIKQSKWCPWELGIADGMGKRTCIFPVMDRKYNGLEYLKLYPYMDYGKIRGTNSDEFWIHDIDSKSKYINLRKWLAGQPLIDHNTDTA